MVQEPAPHTEVRNETDNNADTCCVGKNFIFLSHTTRTADVYPSGDSYQPLRNVPIVTACTAWDDPETGQTYLLVINECLYSGTKLDHTLINPNQLRHFEVGYSDNPFEFCLHSDRGYSYLFELGLSLQRGDESSNEVESCITQVLVAKFNHFKEVLTMVWNEETAQKPAEVTVSSISGERSTGSRSEDLEIDRGELLESFRAFERRYKSLLGEYIKPKEGLKSMVHKTSVLADKFKPVSFSESWGSDVKREFPNILAGVFALFTVLKSGVSYNRTESSGGASNIGEKLLMKPHNIQVLTLLYMLGC